MYFISAADANIEQKLLHGKKATLSETAPPILQYFQLRGHKPDTHQMFISGLKWAAGIMVRAFSGAVHQSASK